MNAYKFVRRMMLAFVILFFVLLIPAYAGDPPQDRTPVFGPQGGSATGSQLAAAMDIPSDLIISAALGTSDVAGAHVFTSQLSGFPNHGGSFGAISSGNAANATRPNSEGSLSTILDGLNNSQGNDLVQLTLVLRVPSGATYWSVDWKFFSEEYPEYVGTQFNDAFLIETPSSNFTISGNNITAPNNVAFDPSGHLVTINTTGAVGMSASNSSGTTYDGATTTLVTAQPIPVGASQITIVFSVMDLGDSVFDTTVFLDNFRFITGPVPSTDAELTVHVQWCAIEGSPSVVDPISQGGSSTSDILNRRLDGVSSIYLAQKTRIKFQSAVPNGVQFEVFGGDGDDDGRCEAGETCTSNFPVIRDPRRPNDTPAGPGSLGDVSGDDEFRRALQSCGEVWNSALTDAGFQGNLGLVAVSARKIVNSNGNPSGTYGVGASNSSRVPLGWLLIADDKLDDKGNHVVAHEVGHALSLHHGNGVNEDNDGDLDEDTNFTLALKSICYATGDVLHPFNTPKDEDGVDNDGDGNVDEDGPEDLNNLMFNCTGDLGNVKVGQGNNLTLNKSDLSDPNTQVGKARRHVLEPFQGDIQYLALFDLPPTEALIDLGSVSMHANSDSGVTAFSAHIADSISTPNGADQSPVDYFFLLDADNDVSTGAPSTTISNETGVPTMFEGAEFILQVTADFSINVPQVFPTVKRFENGSFVQIEDPSIQARISEIRPEVLFEPGSYTDVFSRAGTIIDMQLSSTLLNPMPLPRFAGMALDPATGVFDASVAKVVSSAEPSFPSCTISPQLVMPGGTVVISAHDLPSISTARVFLRDRLVTTVSTGGAPDMELSLVIPTDTVSGEQPVALAFEDTAVTANCTVIVTNPPVFVVPPSPPAGTEFSISVGNNVSITIESIDSDIDDVVTLGAVGMPVGAEFDVAPGNPASGLFSWTPTAGQEGVYVIPFTATDNHGSSAQPLSVVVVVQAAESEAPSISLVKSASPATYNTAGQAITYNYMLQNTGTVALNGPFSIADDKLGTFQCGTATSLAPDASVTCTRNYIIQQSDLDVGSVTNIATATGAFGGQPVTSKQSSATVTAIQSPALLLTKSANPTIFSYPGQVIVYIYVTANTGNVTLSGPFTISDDKLGTFQCGMATSLAPGESVTCNKSYTIQSADLSDLSMVTNPPVPADATITSAKIEINSFNATNQTVRLHRVTIPWSESTVTWNSFGAGFDPTVIGTFTTEAADWRTVDVTALVSAWMDGTYRNYGILLEQGATDFNTYASGEYTGSAKRPRLTICYTSPTGGNACVTIQRSKATPTAVPDAYILQGEPDLNAGSHVNLITGLVDGGEKQSLLRFDLKAVITNRATATGNFGANTVTSDQAQATINQVPPSAKLTRTNVTCNAFANGTATDLAELQYTYTGPKITGVSPSTLFYYSKVTAPASNFTLQVGQSNDNAWISLPPKTIADIVLYDAACTNSTAQGTTTYDATNGETTIQVNGATADATYYLAIKYNAGSLVKTAITQPFPTVLYTFLMYIDNNVVLTSQDNLNVKPK